MASVIDIFGKIPMLGKYISGNREIFEKAIMQSLAALSRYPINKFTTNLGERVLSFIIGVGGVGLVNKFIRSGSARSEWLEFFSNYIARTFEGGNESARGFGAAEDAKRALRNLKRGNFAGVGDAMFQNVSQIKAELRRLKSRAGFGSLLNFGDKIANFFRKGWLRTTEGTYPEREQLEFRGGRSNVAQAGDYKYEGRNDWFRHSDKFSKPKGFGRGFRTGRLFKESGSAVYEN
jgi:hypothetical protein